MTTYRITLDAIEPESLSFGTGVQVTIHAETLYGTISVDLAAADRGTLLEYLRTHWGSEQETGLDWNAEIKAVTAEQTHDEIRDGVLARAAKLRAGGEGGTA